ncbi:protein takeout-like [Haematobia irritans]|uniref:protein takeout-like n=1 Tax=Haematobia irritans TaxID=7368 RepID=UPI003F508E31
MNLQPKINIIVLILVSLFVGDVLSGKFLNPRPDFLKYCTLNGPDFSKCFSKNFEQMTYHWRAGVPGLKSAGALDPLHVKRVGIQHAQPPLAIDVDLTNIEITGFAGVQVPQTDYSFEKLTSVSTLVIPKFKITSDYKLKGQILNLNLNAVGKMNIAIDNFTAKLYIHYKLRDSDGLTFGDIDKLRMEIIGIDHLSIHMTDIFKGQKDLEDNVNSLFNDNWREFYELLRPAILTSTEAVMNDRLTKVFSFIPVQYIFDKFPTAAEYYG